MVDELLLLIISSPSGAGKTTLTRDLLAHFNDLTFSVSHTTRKPRASEIEGQDYYFVSRTKFDELVDAHAFVEWAEVHGNFYGTSLAEIERARAEKKHGIVFDVDYQGARQIRAGGRTRLAYSCCRPRWTSCASASGSRVGRRGHDRAPFQQRARRDRAVRICSTTSSSTTTWSTPSCACAASSRPSAFAGRAWRRWPSGSCVNSRTLR